jgi:nitroreductase
VTHPKQAAPDHPIGDLLARRWSPYAWAERSVSDEDLRALFEAARAAFQSVLSCLVEGNQAWARFAPVLALGVAMRNLARGGKPNRACFHDLGLASGNLCCEATARGLLVHQMIGILPDRAREVFAIPADAEALTGLAIGYPGDGAALPEALRGRDSAPRTRRPLREFVFGARWSEPAAFLK